MRFVFTLAVATFKGHPVQEIIGDYPANSLQELFADIHKGQRWFLVEQFYHRNAPTGEREFESRGKILLNAEWCAKIKEFVENERN